VALDDPFAAADAAAPPEAQAEITSRILAKHAVLKAERTLVTPPRSRPVVSESFLSRSAPVTRVDVVMGVILANGWVDEGGQRSLRYFFRAHASSLTLRMRGGVSQLLVTRGIITADQARELELTLADQGPFPHYRVGRLLGAGGLGRTYSALDIANATEVAFKVFRVADAERRQRFLDEHASIARLAHPSVAQALACGADGEACFAATRLVPGVALATVLGQERVAPEAWALRIAHQIAEALGYVHARSGQVHLSLSLGNVLLPRAADEARMFPPGERVVVTDFGLAALAGARRGDPAFGSPELLRGDAVDARSDIFSLGALLHRMLTGRAPTAHEVATGIDPARLAKGLHPLTREAVVTALRADPDQRYADVEVLLAVLAQAAREVAEEYAHEPQIVRPQDVSTRVLRRHLAPGPLGEAAARAAKASGRERARQLRGDADSPQH
jgi:serine/threonine protein kinase